MSRLVVGLKKKHAKYGPPACKSKSPKLHDSSPKILGKDPSQLIHHECKPSHILEDLSGAHFPKIFTKKIYIWKLQVYIPNAPCFFEDFSSGGLRNKGIFQAVLWSSLHCPTCPKWWNLLRVSKTGKTSL